MRLSAVPVLPWCQVGQRVPVHEDELATLNQRPGVYIVLTADYAGNAGLLINETISGSGRTLEATAEINYPGAPRYHGKVIHLINTEGAFVRPQETSGIWQIDEIRSHNHATYTVGGGNRRASPTDGRHSRDPSYRSSTTVGGSETRPKHDSDPYILRIF